MVARLYVYILYLFSKAFHSLVHHAMNSGSSSDAESKEEALAIYQDVCEIVENQAKVKYHFWLYCTSFIYAYNLHSNIRFEIRVNRKWSNLTLGISNCSYYLLIYGLLIM